MRVLELEGVHDPSVEEGSAENGAGIFKRSDRAAITAEVAEKVTCDLHARIGELAVGYNLGARNLKHWIGKCSRGIVNSPISSCQLGRSASYLLSRGRGSITPSLVKPR